MTAAGRITTARLEVGMRIHVWPHGGDISPTTRKGDPIATVTGLKRAKGVRQYRVIVQTDRGTMDCAPSQTQKLAQEA